MELKGILGYAVLVLSIVNGLMLLRYYLRDRPSLTVHPIHPEVYQWWFRLPDGEFQGILTRRYGFLAYIGVTNRGLRKVSFESWTLQLHTLGRKKVELKAISIPEPKIELIESKHLKVWPVLGQKGPSSEGDTLVDSGVSIGGMAYYVAEFYGGEAWNPKISDGKIVGILIIEDVFGNKARNRFVFTEQSLEYVKSIVEDIDKIYDGRQQTKP